MFRPLCELLWMLLRSESTATLGRCGRWHNELVSRSKLMLVLCRFYLTSWIHDDHSPLESKGIGCIQASGSELGQLSLRNCLMKVHKNIVTCWNDKGEVLSP
jgi:hypothetical protein